MDLIIRQYLTKAKEHNDPGGVQAAYRLIRDAAAGGDGTTKQTACCFSPELCVLCAEEALQLGCCEISTACLKMYFEGQPPANQFLCRAYLCEGQLTMSQSTTGSVEDFEKAALCFLKAIEISKDKPRYHFVVFNASVLYFKAARPLLRPGLRAHLVPSLTQVVRALEEVAEQDLDWRAQLMILLVECLVDSGNTKDACSFAKVTEDFIKLNHLLHLYPKIFTLLVQHKLFENDRLDINQQCTVIYKIQQLKDNTDESNKDKLKKKEEEDTAAKLKEIFDLLVECTAGPAPPQSTPIPPVDRVALLLELSLLSLQLRHPETAADCLKELKSAEDATAGQRIMMECVQCELCLLSKEGKMNDYSKACVEERLKEIRKLDQCLQSAEREGDPGSMQAVCASQWRACLPLLQPNLRRNIKAELLRVAQVLENTQSMLLDTRCQVHSELAVIEEEEEGRFDAAWSHLHKALLLDDGTWREHLSTAVHLLQLRGSLYQATSRTEDKAAMLLQQTKNRQPQDKTDSRPLLVEVGLLLAPDSFQMVLDADNSSKIPSGSPGSGPVAQLSAKAQHHSGSVQRVEGHLTRLGDDTNPKERVKLWAALVKTARRQEVWDVCRTACRFCLLYDDGRWNASKIESKRLKQEIHEEAGHGHKPTQRSEKDLLCLLAEVCFINAEATIQKLRAEGVQFNSPAVHPEERGTHVSADDQHWAVYSDWIQGLSAYATSSFLRAAELGSEIKEHWVVANTAIYLWNYNKHLLEAGEYHCLVPTFQRLVGMLRQTQFYGDRVLFVLLCDAVARGLIQPLCEPDGRRTTPAEDKAKKGAGKVMERVSNLHGVPIDPAALQDIRKALELCDCALHLSNCNVPWEHVPIAVRRQVVATWVQIKTHLQQQIGPKMDIDDECMNETVSAMTRVLVGVEMLRCNSNPGQMEFSVPSLSTLVRMASDCLWSDAVVELQVWGQLAAFCHRANEHSLVLLCTQSALQLETAAAQRLKAAPCAQYGPSAVNGMLSSAACLRGLSLVHESNGDPRSYTHAMEVLLSSVSYAEKAEDVALCMAAARHYWNTCLPLTHTPAERCQLQQPLEKILSALTNTGNKDTKQRGVKSLTTLTPGSSQPEASSENDLAVQVAIYSLLFYIHIDRSDWKSALQLLDKAIRDMPRTRHRLLLYKHRVLTRARLGESVSMDMQKFRDEGEVYCSDMWHQVALCARDLSQQLTCYQNAITSLVNVESQWQKVGLLLEFGEWLYSQNFPIADNQNQVQWAIDILLHFNTAQAEGEDEDQSNDGGVTPVKSESLVGVQLLREVKRLDSLVRAYTLLAVMADRASPQYQLNLLRAYTFVLQIWKVSMEMVHETYNETAKNLPAQKSPSSASKKDKSTDKDKGKGKKAKDIQPPPTDEKPRRQLQEEVLPTSPEEWARYACPEEARTTFRTNRSPHCINTHSITKETRSLFYLDLLAKELQSLSLTHLTLPILHLAETIAHDLADRRSLSDLYRFRIVKICCQLGLETFSPYHGKLVNLSSIKEQEQMRCRKAMALQRARRSLDTAVNEKEVDHLGGSGPLNAEACAHHIWLDKAEVCLSMGLYQHARQLLAEAHLVAMEVGDQAAVARALLGLARLACEEQNHAQALLLLEKAQELGGDEEFWYCLTLTRVKATVGMQRGPDAHSKIADIIKQGCTTLNSVLEQRPNRAAAIRFLIMSLETRGAVEHLHAGGLLEPGECLSTQTVQRLMSTCDTLGECASGFIKLGYREQAAEAHLEHAQALRILAKHSADMERKRRHLLDAFYQMQFAVSEQEHVVLNAQNLLPTPAYSRAESPSLTLAARRKLQRLRLSLAELSLAMLELRCAEQTRHTLARERKSSVEMALEDFTRSTPDPDSIEQEWVCVGKTLGQVTMGQCHLAAVCFPSPDSLETRARCLVLTGKCLRLQAALKDPILPSAVWDTHSQEKAWSEAKAVPGEREDIARQKGTESCSAEAKAAELQKRRHEAQQLLAQASETLAQAVNVCLQHKLSSSTLADASHNMLECHGQLNPVVAGQYLALLQSCRSAAAAAQVLSSACCVDTSASRLSALLNLRGNLLRGQEEQGPSSMLKGVEDALSNLTKAYGHITINPNHLSILGELPSNLRILLLQHTEDGSELYGAFYEKSKLADTPKGKPLPASSSLRCSRVAKVSVCPRALLTLRDRAVTFSLETVVEKKTTADEETGFRDIVHGMEDYLHPILSQFDFSCFRHRAPSISDPDPPKPKEKEEKVGSDKGLSVSSPIESGETLVVLADRRLLQLPLEALSVLQEEGLSSVSRDFSLQFLHSRLHREEPEKVESDNKKETKGGKAAKGKGDQSKTIKVVPVNRVLPVNAIPVDTRHIKYIVDLYEGPLDGTSSLTERMKMTLEKLSQHLTAWEGSKQTPSLSEVQHLLCKCSGFIYLGRERFMANIPPSKLAALNLSECRMALLFDLVQNSASSLQSNTDTHKSAGLLALDRPLETAVLLSLTGVRCIVLNQWHSSVQRNTHHMDSVLDSLLRAGMTSGQSVHASRKGDVNGTDRDPKCTGLNDAVSQSDFRSNGSPDDIHKVARSLSPFNCILYGLPNLVTI